MFNPGISEKSCLDRAPVKRRFLLLCSSDFDSACWYGKLTQFRSFRCRFHNFRINNEPCVNFWSWIYNTGFCRICIWIGLYFIGKKFLPVTLIETILFSVVWQLSHGYFDLGFIIFGQEMRAVAISKVGHKMQNFAEGLEHKINTFSWPIKGGFSRLLTLVIYLESLFPQKYVMHANLRFRIDWINEKE